MDSPVRKMQKKNDYNRHKLFRKMKRQRKAKTEQESHVAEKELKKKLKVKQPKFDVGKDITLIDKDKLRMDPNSGLFQDESGNIIGDSVILPDVQITSGHRATHAPKDMQGDMYNQWLINQASTGKPDFSIEDRDAYERLMQRTALQNEVKNSVGYDGTVYQHGNGALEQVYPEMDLIMMGAPLKDLAVYSAKKTGNLIGDGFEAAARAHSKWAQETAARYYSKHPDELFMDYGIHNGPEIRVGGATDLTKGMWQNPSRTTQAIKPPVMGLPYQEESYIVPEQEFGYIKPRTTFNLENGQPIVKLPDGKMRLKPKQGQIQSSGWKISDIVDENGNIDTGMAMSAFRAARQIAEKDLASTGRSTAYVTPHDHYRQYFTVEDVDGERIKVKKGDYQGNLRHMYESAKSAQSAPVAKGSTKQRQVFTALSHDIGEIEGRRDVQSGMDVHPSTSVSILRRMFGDSMNPDDLNAIAHHMDPNKMFSHNPILQALDFADSASGRTYSEYMRMHPAKGFAKETPVENVFTPKEGETTRDVVKNRINPVLKAYGYDTLPLDVPEEEQRRLLMQTIMQHRSMVRGAKDPAHKNKDYNAAYDRDVTEGAKRYFHTDNPTKDQRIQYIAEHTTDRSKDHGQMGKDAVNQEYYLTGDVQPNYYSNSAEDIAAGYATKHGEASRVHLPLQKDISDMSLVDMWANSDFPLYAEPHYGKGAVLKKEYEKLTRDQLDELEEDGVQLYNYPDATNRLSYDYDYRLPYRLYTGRSLVQDTKNNMEKKQKSL